MDYNPKMPSPFISNSFDQKYNKVIDNNNKEAGNPETYCPTAPKYNSSNIARPENTNTSLLNLSSVLVASYNSDLLLSVKGKKKTYQNKSSC